MTDTLATTPSILEEPAAQVEAPAEPSPVNSATDGLRVDISELKSSYCNVCNANSTREEVVLNFGVSHGWDHARGRDIRLLHRIVLSPPIAKRIAVLLGRVIEEYEGRYGTLT